MCLRFEYSARSVYDYLVMVFLCFYPSVFFDFYIFSFFLATYDFSAWAFVSSLAAANKPVSWDLFSWLEKCFIIYLTRVVYSLEFSTLTIRSVPLLKKRELDIFLFYLLWMEKIDLIWKEERQTCYSYFSVLTIPFFYFQTSGSKCWWSR